MSKNQINLPKTAFSMKANLPIREPEILKLWKKIDLYKELRNSRKGEEKFVLHDGPPYANGNIHMGTALNKILKEEIVKILAENSSDLEAFDVEDDAVPYVILVVGVNGVGKTTTIGKLASQFKDGGLKVLIGAADTFRAAAVDQIKMWGDRVGVDVVSHGMNTDPASVAFDTVKKAVEEKYDIVIIDTAGRLHTKLNLMNELSKIKRVVQKFKPDAPHEVMLILDGSTGQNAFVQAEEFTKATDVNSITITKLDGTAKGGVVIGITDRFKIPIKYIGVGEKVGDLKLFHKGEFVNSFFD